MVTIPELWLPILLSAVVVFLVSFVVHSFLKYHQSDFAGLSSESEVMGELKKFSIPPGEYVFPYAASNKERQTPEFKDKIKSGPVAFLTVIPNGMPSMTGSLVQWFIYCLVVGVFAAYLAGRALEPGVSYLSVFRFVGTTSFLGYGLALAQESIWFYKSWKTTMKNLSDGLLYALLTAGMFGWLWPE